MLAAAISHSVRTRQRVCAAGARAALATMLELVHTALALSRGSVHWLQATVRCCFQQWLWKTLAGSGLPRVGHRHWGTKRSSQCFQKLLIHAQEQQRMQLHARTALNYLQSRSIKHACKLIRREYNQKLRAATQEQLGSQWCTQRRLASSVQSWRVWMLAARQVAAMQVAVTWACQLQLQRCWALWRKRIENARLDSQMRDFGAVQWSQVQVQLAWNKLRQHSLCMHRIRQGNDHYMLITLATALCIWRYSFSEWPQQQQHPEQPEVSLVEAGVLVLSRVISEEGTGWILSLVARWRASAELWALEGGSEQARQVEAMLQYTIHQCSTKLSAAAASVLARMMFSWKLQVIQSVLRRWSLNYEADVVQCEAETMRALQRAQHIADHELAAAVAQKQQLQAELLRANQQLDQMQLQLQQEPHQVYSPPHQVYSPPHRSVYSPGADSALHQCTQQRDTAIQQVAQLQHECSIISAQLDQNQQQHEARVVGPSSAEAELQEVALAITKSTTALNSCTYRHDATIHELAQLQNLFRSNSSKLAELDKFRHQLEQNWGVHQQGLEKQADQLSASVAAEQGGTHEMLSRMEHELEELQLVSKHKQLQLSEATQHNQLLQRTLENERSLATQQENVLKERTTELETQLVAMQAAEDGTRLQQSLVSPLGAQFAASPR